ncbi:DUF3500 domain-containing protein [Mariniblastus fucicola]|uniref:DUF3500 domain-containing protein n=1 Tax=Mariniblastus fucicola TaxID=980251 RepID=A0A5B9PBK2_9BACT|nr:DUF3500 domain-containing protein [Mariniblastus fucicola]QEG23738.1 hypothetical protein MFFC18_36400 [Mariniblastus fucicola]
MFTRASILRIVALVVFAQIASIGCAQTAEATADATPAEVVAKAVDAANAFLKSVDQSQYEQVMYSFLDNDQRDNWSNLPVANVPRGGLRWGDLKENQQQAAMQLLKATLSENGVQQVIDNMNGDEFLKQNSRRRTSFGSDEYFISILGEPSTTSPWMYQFGGHHLAINITIVGDQMTMSPTLTGGQPIDFEWEGKQVRQVADEEDAAYAFIESLTDDQKKKAVIAERYGDIRFGPGATKIEPAAEGMKATELDEKQLQLLKVLIGKRIGVLNATHAKIELEKIEADLAETWISWKGSTKNGGDASFRIQSPSILMEYSPQRLGGVPMNHIHAMYRDPSNDYGAGLIEARRKEKQKK